MKLNIENVICYSLFNTIQLKMLAVHTFARSDNEILEGLIRVFSTGRGTAREQWSLQAEMLVEPVGWDALWKLSKEFCKKFGKIFFSKISIFCDF